MKNESIKDERQQQKTKEEILAQHRYAYKHTYLQSIANDGMGLPFPSSRILRFFSIFFFVVEWIFYADFFAIVCICDNSLLMATDACHF